MDPLALPPAVRSVTDAVIARQDVRVLRRAARALSTRYRQPARGFSPLVRSLEDANAYLAVRAPATYAATRSVLGEVAARLPAFAPRSLLDLGCGPGTATWAALDQWPSLTRLSLLDRDPRLLALAQHLLEASRLASSATIRWCPADIRTAPLRRADLVCSSYTLNEIGRRERESVIDRMWATTAHTLVIVEPGTPQGFAAVLAARQRLCNVGAHIVAPCPTAGSCPKAVGDAWCHFAVRLPRSEPHRTVKQTRLGYEDEKYSYLVASRHPARRVSARVTAMPKKASGLVILQLCEAPDLTERIVTRRDSAYHRAKKLRWGSAMPDDG